MTTALKTALTTIVTPDALVDDLEEFVASRRGTGTVAESVRVRLVELDVHLPGIGAQGLADAVADRLACMRTHPVHTGASDAELIRLALVRALAVATGALGTRTLIARTTGA